MAKDNVTMAPDLLERLEAAEARATAAEAQVAALKSASGGRIVFKVSTKGAVSAYGLQRWPVTLYREQWERLIAEIPRLEAYIKARAADLSVKPPKEAEVKTA